MRADDVVVLSLASSGPTQSIAVTLATDSLDAIEIVFGFGFAVAGLIISFIVARTGHVPFYTDPRSSHGDRIEEDLAEPEPS